MLKLLKKINPTNALFSAIGAFICISFLSYLNFFQEGSLWLIPPFGATMVLVMAVHESPLAQPKNIILGHTLSALSGVVIFTIFGMSSISIGLGVALSVFVMMITKTVHPPAGANPIIAIIGAKGFSFVLMPVAVGAVFIVLFAYVYNNILKREYPKSWVN